MSTTLRAGTILGSYRIVAPLGAGGMGEVYRAHDAKLDRAVALKILPAEVVRDAERVRRFVQEARSASSLSHPNIVHVYDIGEAVPIEEGTEPAAGAATLHYLAMELVEGSTLRQIFADRSIEPRTLLSYLAQAAEGLAKAHAAGIVHRDLKPENIMVSRDGYAKVLDFGLAKLTEASVSGSALAAAPTALAEEHTREGAVVGTIGYMSPEQAQGKPVDHRTDLFAFGCLLYEAATGKRPFTGESSVDVLHAIVRETPEPVEKLAPTIPRALVRKIRRCLEKDPAKRAQSMKDLAFELHDLVDEWETLATPTGTVTTGPSHTTGTAPPAKAGVGRAGWIAIAAGALAVAAAGLWIWTSRGRAPSAAAENSGFRSMQLTPLTSSGDVFAAALSPDGRYLAHIRANAAGISLWVRQIATGSDVELVPAAGPDRDLYNARFTPDGNYVSYETLTTRSAARIQNDLFLVPTLGGAPRVVLGDIDSPAGWSPDGRRFAFVRRDVVAGETRLLTAAADGSDEKLLSTRHSTDGEFLTDQGNVGPAWSPDGTTIAVPGWTKQGGPEIALVSANDGSTRQLDGLTVAQLRGLAWMPDGHSFVAAVRLDGSARNIQLVRIAMADGRVERITNDLSDYGAVSLDATGTHLVSTQNTESAELWTVPVGGGAGSRLLGSGGRETYGGPDAAADGTLVYVLERGSERAIWKKPPGGSPPVQLTHRGPAGAPQISADGRRIAFVSPAPDGTFEVYTMNSDGGDLRQVEGGSTPFFSLAPDGSWLVYMTPDRALIRRSLADGTEQRLDVAGSSIWRPMVSPDGSRIAYMASIQRPDGSAENVAAVIPATGGKPLATVPRPSSSEAQDWEWHPDGRSLLYARFEGTGANVWRLPLDGSASTRLSSFESTPIFGFTMTLDGKTIVFGKGSVSSDAVMIENFR